MLVLEKNNTNNMQTDFYDNFKLGILGGGQLGRMLIQQAINYNIHISILDPDKNAPCKDIANNFIVGSLNDYDTVYAFGKQVNMLTIEIEHVNVEALRKLEEEGIPVFPQPSILKMIQRVVCNHHTVLQVCVGAIIGSITGYLFYYIATQKVKGQIREKPDDFGPI